MKLIRHARPSEPCTRVGGQSGNADMLVITGLFAFRARRDSFFECFCLFRAHINRLDDVLCYVQYLSNVLPSWVVVAVNRRVSDFESRLDNLSLAPAEIARFFEGIQVCTE